MAAWRRPGTPGRSLSLALAASVAQAADRRGEIAATRSGSRTTGRACCTSSRSRTSRRRATR